MPICPDCERFLTDENALYQHRKSKHGLSAQQKPKREPEEMSLADEIIEAKFSGNVPDYLREMFPDEF